MDHGPDVLPCQGGVVFENFLEIAPALKIVQNDVQRDSRPFDARSPAHDAGVDADPRMIFQQLSVIRLHENDYNRSTREGQTMVNAGLIAGNRLRRPDMRRRKSCNLAISGRAFQCPGRRNMYARAATTLMERFAGPFWEIRDED